MNLCAKFSRVSVFVGRVFFNLIRNVDLPCHPPLIFLPYMAYTGQCAAGQGMVLDLSVPCTVELPYTTTACKRAPIQKKQQQQNFPSQNLTVGTSSKRPPPVTGRDHFLGLKV